MPDISILYPPCHAVVNFDNVQLAAAFLSTLAHMMTPDVLLDMVHKLIPSPDAVETMKQTLNACMGQPA